MILVTGGGGVLGSALVEELRTAGETCHVVGSSDCDLRDTDATVSLFRKIRPRLVFHAAGRVHGLGGNARYPAEMFVDNIRMNTNVIEAARLAGCEKIVAVSTVATYPANAPIPIQEASLWNGPPHGGEAAYGHAKRAMLAHLEAARTQYGLKFAYALMTNLYGPNDRFDATNGHVIPSLVAKMHQAVRSGSAVEVWGSGSAERDFLFSADAARALIVLAARHEGAINVATGETVRVREVVEILAGHAGVGEVIWDANRPDGQLKRGYDVSKLEAFGFMPQVSLGEGLRRTYEWYDANHPNVRS